ncbi:rhamnogalacturonan lyase [Segatella bryantii]|uniref:rhamnogalacturonan lyase n=1 Tax=Segatella bryantii TaxID=77095 RepID=UPI001EDB77FC|nr:rhamnogalacturonan lyase [Segatella bryantii]UKK74802.1 rhamnogalacturonan lyase [Segatella bryantii]
MKNQLRAMALTGLLAATTTPLAIQAQNTPVSQMEKITRGIIAVPAMNATGEFVSWRLLGTDNAKTTTFDVLRDGQTIASNLKNVTSYLDTNGNASSKYQIVTRVNGVKTETSAVVTPWSDKYLKVKLSSPGSQYTPNDCSVGDVDGDGEYEIIVKWNPENAKDNSQSGKTDAVFLDCYKFSGQRLWRIDLGYNIRAGAHYTQHLVYDFDGDGKAEVICKTAPLTKDGKGQYVTAAATDSNIKNASQTNYRNSSGYILSGPEFLTVFNGQTGSAIHTVWYNPNRAGGASGAASMPSKSFWGDTYGNRCDRYLSAVAYLNGAGNRPSAILCRGYYTRAYVWAVDFDGKKLSTRWLHASTSSTSASVTDANGNTTTKSYGSSTANRGSHTLYGNGNHNLSIADIDGDGCDEIIYGSGALDNNGYLLYATGYGHGDAIHVGDFNPDRAGLEVFQVHEESPYGWDLHDAKTGQILYSATTSGDNGRGMAGCFVANKRGGQFSSYGDRSLRSAVDNSIITTNGTSCNFRIYWDGSLQDNWFDTNVSKWNGSSATTIFSPGNYSNSKTCNTTKATPCLQADIFGDWREEIVEYSGDDNTTLTIFTSTEATNYRVPCLMHDHTYRMAVAWQQSAYNQPPHLGYYLPDAAAGFIANSSITVQDDSSSSSATMPAVVPQNGVILWPFEQGVAHQLAVVGDDLKNYVTTDVTIGSGLTYGGVKELNDLTETRIGVTVDNNPAPDDNNKLSFNIVPLSGYSLNITRIDFTATRIGTDGGNIDVSWCGNKIASGLRPARNAQNPEYTTYCYNVTTTNPEKGHKLTFNVYNLGITKQMAFANIKLYGTISQTANAKSNIIDNAVTGIVDVQSDASVEEKWYTLSGVRIKAPTQSGIYILNGKKVSVKK